VDLGIRVARLSAEGRGEAAVAAVAAVAAAREARTRKEREEAEEAEAEEEEEEEGGAERTPLAGELIHV